MLESQGGQLALLLVLALLLRMAFVFSQAPDAFLIGGDGPWYIMTGWLIAHHAPMDPLATVGPLYPLTLALTWLLFPTVPQPLGAESIPAAYLNFVRMMQIGLSLLTVWLGYQLARGLSGKHAAGMIAAVGLGIGPAFVIEPIYILSEPVFMALLALWAWLYLRAQSSPSAWGSILAGLALSAAALTRPVVLLLPIVLVPHQLLVHGWRQGAKRLAPLLLAFALPMLPWIVYLYQTTGSFAPQGFLSNLWMGAVGSGGWEGTATTYWRSQEFGADSAGYAREALRAIAAHPLQWLASAIRQPCGGDSDPAWNLGPCRPQHQAIVRRLAFGRSLRLRPAGDCRLGELRPEARCVCLPLCRPGVRDHRRLGLHEALA